MEIRLSGICLDCGDAEEMARFYTAVFGWEETARDDTDTRAGGTGWICMNGPAGGPSVADRDAETLRVRLDPAGHPFCLGLFGT